MLGGARIRSRSGRVRSLPGLEMRRSIVIASVQQCHRRPARVGIAIERDKRREIGKRDPDVRRLREFTALHESCNARSRAFALDLNPDVDQSRATPSMTTRWIASNRSTCLLSNFRIILISDRAGRRASWRHECFPASLAAATALAFEIRLRGNERFTVRVRSLIEAFNRHRRFGSGSGASGSAKPIAWRLSCLLGQV